MMFTDARFAERVETAVAALEADTDAEVVVVAAPRSGSYRDVSFAATSALTWVALLVMMELPHPLHPTLVLVDLLLVWAGGAWLFSHPAVLARLSSRTRQDRQVGEAAAAAFHEEAVHATPRRTGLLIYVSALEGRVSLIPDVGLEARIPQGRWAMAATQFSHSDLDHFIAGLGHVGTLLAEVVPRVDGQRVDLANAPRIRS